MVAGAARVVCSPLRRTRETAEALGLPVETDERWIELDYGVLDGTPAAGRPRRRRGPAGWPTSTSPPRAASRSSAVGTRVRAACEDLAAEAAERDVVVVTHVSPLKAAVAWTLGVADEVTWHLYAAPASITRISTSGPRRSLHCYNGTAHLDGLGG